MGKMTKANCGASMAPSQKSTPKMNKGGMAAPKFKPCAGCPSPSACGAAGKCKKKSGMYGGGMAKKKKK